MIAEQMRKDYHLTGEEIFSCPKEEVVVLGITESSRDHKWQNACISVADNEPTDFINRSNITLKSRFLESPQDLTQVYEFPRRQHLLSDAKMLDAFIMYVGQKLEERDLIIRELQFEIEKINKKKKFSSAGFRLPKDYYENEAYLVE